MLRKSVFCEPAVGRSTVYRPVFWKPIVAVLFCCVLASCALLKQPIAATTLTVELPASMPDWPATFKLLPMRADVALQNEELLVRNGAILMRYHGLRWALAPETMMDEALHEWQTRATAKVMPNAKPLHTLAPWLHDFAIHIDAAGAKSAVVSVSAELSCGNASTSQLAAITANVVIQTDAASEIAKAFETASAKVFRDIFQAAVEQSAQCGE